MSSENNPADFESANDVGGPDDTLRPTEALDSDEVRNDDGDEVVDPPADWSAPMQSETGVGAEGGETLDDKLAAERPDPGAGQESRPDDEPGDVEVRSDDEIDRLVPEDTGTDAGQISGTPEDGDSYFPVVE